MEANTKANAESEKRQAAEEENGASAALLPSVSTPAPGMQDAPTAGKARRRVDWPTASGVSLLVLLGLVLRLWGIGWSLPNARHPRATYHPDERVNLIATQSVDIAHGQFDTNFYNYGAFYFYLANFAQTFGRGYGLIPVTPPLPADTPLSPAERLTRQAPENAGLILAGRLATALLGAATIPLIFALGARLYGRRTGFAAALLYAIAPLAVVHAHFMTVDVPATFFVTLALLLAARLLAAPTRRDYVLAGVACGLCAATKYNTGLVLIAPLVAHFLSGKASENKAAEKKAGRESLPLLLAATLLAFLIACPGPLLNWDAFWNGTYPGTGVHYELFVHSRLGTRPAVRADRPGLVVSPGRVPAVWPGRSPAAAVACGVRVRLPPTHTGRPASAGFFSCCITARPGFRLCASPVTCCPCFLSCACSPPALPVKPSTQARLPAVSCPSWAFSPDC